MTNLLARTAIPLWALIVIIAVGSLFVLVVAGSLLRCLLRRRMAQKGPEIDGLTGPTRRVTLRRGRMVPTSQHLSLTGSIFGTRQFGLLADNESTMTGRRSPFEWWNTIMDRSARPDEMSQVETGSISTRPSSRATVTRGRRDGVNPSPSGTPDKELFTKEVDITAPPSASPSPRGHRSVNFSRSFTNRAASSPLAARSQLTLSRISEKSPHQSIISVSSPNLLGRASQHSALAAVVDTPSPRLSRPPWVSAQDLSEKTRISSSSLQYGLDRPRSTASNRSQVRDIYHPVPLSITVPKAASYRNSSSTQGSPPLYRGASYSPVDPSGRVIDHGPRESSTVPKCPSPLGIGDASDARPGESPHQRSSFAAQENMTGPPQAPRDHHAPQRDSQPWPEKEKDNLLGIVTGSKKNAKVLRKKSLKRMQVVSSIAT